ncbi:uncharacterized protein LOC144097960 [Amblyomma americanum]
MWSLLPLGTRLQSLVWKLLARGDRRKEKLRHEQLEQKKQHLVHSYQRPDFRNDKCEQEVAAPPTIDASHKFSKISQCRLENLSRLNLEAESGGLACDMLSQEARLAANAERPVLASTKLGVGATSSAGATKGFPSALGVFLADVAFRRAPREGVHGTELDAARLFVVTVLFGFVAA